MNAESLADLIADNRTPTSYKSDVNALHWDKLTREEKNAYINVTNYCLHNPKLTKGDAFKALGVSATIYFNAVKKAEDNTKWTGNGGMIRPDDAIVRNHPSGPPPQDVSVEDLLVTKSYKVLDNMATIYDEPESGARESRQKRKYNRQIVPAPISEPSPEPEAVEDVEETGATKDEPEGDKFPADAAEISDVDVLASVIKLLQGFEPGDLCRIIEAAGIFLGVKIYADIARAKNTLP